MRTNKLQINQIAITKTLVFAIFAVIALYVYMIISMAFTTADREVIAKTISIRQSEIGELESRIIVESRNVSRDLAAQIGLSKSVADEALVVVRDVGTKLTLNE